MLAEDKKSIIINILQDEISNIEHIVLFGSAINKNFDVNKSDIDIAFISQDTLSNVQRWDIQEKLAAILNFNVDLIDLVKSDDVFRFEVISKGKVLFTNKSTYVENFLDSTYINYIQLNDDRREIMEKYA